MSSSGMEHILIMVKINLLSCPTHILVAMWWLKSINNDKSEGTPQYFVSTSTDGGGGERYCGGGVGTYCNSSCSSYSCCYEVCDAAEACEGSAACEMAT